MAGLDRSATWTSGDVDAHNLKLGLGGGQGHSVEDPARPRSVGGVEGALLLHDSHRGGHGGGGAGGGECSRTAGGGGH